MGRMNFSEDINSLLDHGTKKNMLLILNSRRSNLRMLMSLLFMLPISSWLRADSVSTGPQNVKLIKKKINRILYDMEMNR